MPKYTYLQSLACLKPDAPQFLNVFCQWFYLPFNLIIITGTQIKTTMRNHLPPDKLAKIKKSDNIK